MSGFFSEAGKVAKAFTICAAGFPAMAGAAITGQVVSAVQQPAYVYAVVRGKSFQTENQTIQDALSLGERPFYNTFKASASMLSPITKKLAEIDGQSSDPDGKMRTAYGCKFGMVAGMGLTIGAGVAAAPVTATVGAVAGTAVAVNAISNLIGLPDAYAGLRRADEARQVEAGVVARNAGPRLMRGYF